MRFFLLKVLFFLVLPAQLLAAEERVLDLTDISQVHLGKYVKYYIEDKQEYSLQDILENKQQTIAFFGDSDAMGLGFGHKPVWIKIKLHNPTNEQLKRFISSNRVWTDYIDLFLVKDGKVIKSFQAGDARKFAPHLNDSLGYLFELDFPQGSSDILVRLETLDPMIIDLRIHNKTGLEQALRNEHYFSGFFYGGIFSLVLYNLILFFRLRRSMYFYYSVFLSTVLLANFTYTGRGLFWLWTDSPDIQRYMIIVFMVLSGVTGIQFTKVFLELKETLPRLAKTINGYIIASISLLLTVIIFDLHALGVWLAFIALSIFVFSAVPIAAYALYRGQKAATYFLVAVVSSMIGIGLTLLSSWGLIVVNDFTTKGVEFGVMIEAVLLALALTEYVRQQMLEKELAQQSARTDPLTNLLNRRGFTEEANYFYKTSKRHHRPLSLIMLDIDGFKAINDQNGHDVGDTVLKELAEILTLRSRGEDVVARWGGEEFVILLPELSLDSAMNAAERIRKTINATIVQHKEIYLQFTSSFGVAELKDDMDIEALIKTADNALFEAKETGRDKVVVGN